MNCREDRHGDPKPRLRPQFSLHDKHETKHRGTIQCWQKKLKLSKIIEYASAYKGGNDPKTARPTTAAVISSLPLCRFLHRQLATLPDCPYRCVHVHTNQTCRDSRP